MINYYPAALDLSNAREVILRNVTIKNFPKGIVAKNSQVSMNNVYLYNNNIGLDIYSSNFKIENSYFCNVGIDVIIKGQSKVEFIKTNVRKILSIIGMYSQLDLEALNIGYLAHKIITTDIDEIDIKEREKLWIKLIAYFYVHLIKNGKIIDVLLDLLFLIFQYLFGSH